MFNSSLDAYGSIRRTAAPQNIAGSQSALVKPITPKQEPSALEKQSSPVDKAALQEAVKKLNEMVAPALQTIEFAIDEDSEKVVVKVVDTTTKKVIRQMPNEEALAFSKTLDKLEGLVIRQTA
jgi:flagellar protein FlaG